MAIHVVCSCGRQFLTGDENIGRDARCTKCGRGLVVPQPGPLDEFAEPEGLHPIRFPASGKATASLVLGLLSVVLAALTGIPAIIIGWRGISDIRQSRGQLRGIVKAVSGITLGLFGSTVVTATLIVPLYQAAREWKRERECATNLKWIALALHGFHATHGSFPPAAITDQQGRPLLSWRVAILPYLGSDEANLYREFNLKEPWDSPHNRALLERMPKFFACPDEPSGVTTTNYLAVVGPRRVFTGKRKGVKVEEITAGTSNTIILAESDRGVHWTAPEEIVDSDVNGPEQGGRHPGGYHIVMADGSVRYLQSVPTSSSAGAAGVRTAGKK